MAASFSPADAGRLMARIGHSIREQKRVTFLFGSALTAPGQQPGERGVPDATRIVEQARALFQDTSEKDALDAALRAGVTDRYQSAMRFVLDTRGQDAVNHLVRHAVLQARLTPPPPSSSQSESDPDLEKLEADVAGWSLRPAVKSVGELINEHPAVFSAPILTSNFDPLLEISLRKTGGQATSIFLSADGQFTNVLAPGIHRVVHFHGFWRGSDTLHTPAQLIRNRPQLKGSLRSVLRDTTLVVMGYGGWSDVFTRTLVEVISEQTAQLDVLWAFYPDSEETIQKQSGSLIQDFDALAGQRIVFYKGVDCHVFLPGLVEKLRQDASSSKSPCPARQSSLAAMKAEYPPQTAIWVGRENELRSLLSSKAKAVAITGLGGNGKSALAAKYLEWRKSAEDIAISCWADCREQNNTLHTQLIRVVHQISRGSVAGAALKEFKTAEVLDTLFALLRKEHALIVFDNIDHYIDVDDAKAIGHMHSLIHRAITDEHSAQFVFTARPALDYSDAGFLQLRLEGFTAEETRLLFEGNGVSSDSAGLCNIENAHALTRGHPLTLNLIATQVATSGVPLTALIDRLRSEETSGVEIPVLTEIWNNLNGNQQTVLRYLAEIVAPEREDRVARYLGTIFTYNKFNKAIRALKRLNLVVVKGSGSSNYDVVELHPLVRDFIRRRYPKEERAPYIACLINFCNNAIQQFRTTVLQAPYEVLENWTTKVELCIRAERYADALIALEEVQSGLRRHASSEELIRLGSEVLRNYSFDNEDERLVTVHDSVYGAIIKTLTELDRYEEADKYLSSLEKTVTGKTARYIMLCAARSYSLFLRGQLRAAIDCAEQGVALKASSNLDTQYDCDHTLALAKREMGDSEGALRFFLHGESLEKICDGAEFDEKRGGHFYGNIGRCLQMQGRLGDALVCYKKSARAMEVLSDSDTLMNRGWAAYWLGEVLEKQEEWEKAFSSYKTAYYRWRVISPKRGRQAADSSQRVGVRAPAGAQLPDDEASCCRMFAELITSGA